MKRLTHMELAAAYDRQDWRLLWEQALPLVKYAVKRLIKSGSLAAEYATDDLLQEGNLAAGKVIRTWDPIQGAFSTWVVRRVTGALANHVARTAGGMVGGRDAHGTTGSFTEEQRIRTPHGPPWGFDDPVEEAERLQTADRVRIAVDGLPAAQRAAIYATAGFEDQPRSLRQFAKESNSTFYAVQKDYAEAMAALQSKHIDLGIIV